MKIAFATCNEIPQGTKDDQHLKSELEKRGHDVDVVSWTSPEAQWAEYDITLIRSTWDYYKRHDEFIRWAKSLDGKTKLLNPLATVEWNFSKNYLMELADGELPAVPTFISRDLTNCADFTRKLLKKGDVIIKPAVSGSSDLTFKIQSEERELEMKLESILERCEAIIQPYIESINTDGEISLIFFKNRKECVYSHCSLKVPQKGDFRVQSEFGGSVQAYLPQENLIEASKKRLQDIGFDFIYARVDVVDYKTSPLIGEIELIEPELFFRLSPDSPALMADALEIY